MCFFVIGHVLFSCLSLTRGGIGSVNVSVSKIDAKKNRTRKEEHMHNTKGSYGYHRPN